MAPPHWPPRPCVFTHDRFIANRSVTLVLRNLPLRDYPDRRSPESIAAALLDALPHLQHVKLVPAPSYVPCDFHLVGRALARLARLQSLDVEGFHASSLPLAELSDVSGKLVSLTFTRDQSDRVENRQHPVFRVVVSNAHHLASLQFKGTQSARDVVEMLSALPHPEQLKHLSVRFPSAQVFTGLGHLALVTALNRLRGLEELDVAVGGGLESCYFPSERRTFAASHSKRVSGSPAQPCSCSSLMLILATGAVGSRSVPALPRSFAYFLRRFSAAGHV